MSFGITSLKKKSVQDTDFKKHIVDFLITGEDFATCLMFCKLVKAHGADKVVWLKSYIEKAEHIESKWEHFSFLSVDTTSFDEVSSACFYKDQQFKSFGGRSQPQEMSDIEVSLVGEACNKSWSDLLGEHEVTEQWSQFDELTAQCVKEVELGSLMHGESEDLIESSAWGVLTTKSELFLANHLYWGLSDKFLRSIMDRSSLSSDETDMIEIKAATQVEIPAIVVNYTFKTSESFDIPSPRVFLPVSQSQEEGHFVGVINENSASFFYHFQESLEVNKEHVAKRLKKLKRNLERILKTDVFNKAEESIYFSSSLFCVPENNELSDKAQKNLYFLSNQSSRNNLLLDKINHLKTL